MNQVAGKWVIALVRYESSKDWYTAIAAEQSEIVARIGGREYPDYATAWRIRCRWVNSGKCESLDQQPGKGRDDRLRMENGRYEFYGWDVFPLDEFGNPGSQYKSIALRRIEYPHKNDPEAKGLDKRYAARRSGWDHAEAAPILEYVKKGQYVEHWACRITDAQVQAALYGLFPSDGTDNLEEVSYWAELLENTGDFSEPVLFLKGRDY